MHPTLLALALGCSPPREVCLNAVDDDENGFADCDDPACAAHCDSDGDGSRDRAFRGPDCDDGDAAVHPGAPEVCDGIDDDCDGKVDSDDPDLDPKSEIYAFVDADSDGYGARPVLACPGEAGTTTLGGDCDDSLASVHLNAPEICDGIDDDCDGKVDLDDPGAIPETVFADADGDGAGDPSIAVLGCPSAGWSPTPDDCDDGDAAVHPSAPEVCDGIDDDCDGSVPADEIDGDGDGDPACSDCDDADPQRSTHLEERCGPAPVDEDCDGLVDDADPSLNPYTCGYCPDADFDAFLRMPLHQELWNPCVLDPDTSADCSTDPDEPDTNDHGRRLHRVTWRGGQGYWRDELFLFLPPGPGVDNTKIRLWATYAGYRTISLGYLNDDSLEHKCASAPETCYRDVLYETAFGADLTQWVDTVPADAVERRLEVLLEKLVEVHPQMGFDRYLLPDGTPDWSRIVVAGWSGGGEETGFIAHYRPVHAAILMSSPKDHISDPFLAPVDWVADPSVTPGCAMMGAWHVDEPYSLPPESILPHAWDLMGMPSAAWDIDEHPGEPVPPGTYRVSQSLPEDQMDEGCDAHASVGSDECLRDDLFPAYLYLFCTAATLDRETCASP